MPVGESRRQGKKYQVPIVVWFVQFIYDFLHLLVVLLFLAHTGHKHASSGVSKIPLPQPSHWILLFIGQFSRHSPIPRKPNSATTNHPPVLADRGGTAPGIQPALKEATVRVIVQLQESIAGTIRPDDGTVSGGQLGNHGWNHGCSAGKDRQRWAGMVRLRMR